MSQQETDQQVLLTLTHDTMKQTLNEINQIHQHVDQIGRTVVSFSKIVVDSHDAINHQELLIGDLAQSTMVVNQLLENLNGATLDRYEHQKVIEDHLSALKQKVVELETLHANQYADAKDRIDNHHKLQYEQLENSNALLGTALQDLQSLDVKTPMIQFSKALEGTQEEIKTSRALIIEQVSQLSDYTYDLNTHLTELINNLTNAYTEMSQPDKLDSMVTQLNTIELYLKTLIDTKE